MQSAVVPRVSRSSFWWWAATILVGGISGAVVSLITLNVGGQSQLGLLRSGQQVTVGLRDSTENFVQVAKYSDALDSSAQENDVKPQAASSERTSERHRVSTDADSETSTPTYAPTGLSPYETIFRKQGKDLPWWAKKGHRLRTFIPPKGNDMCYIHVGKTAGSSIGCALGFRLHCNYEEGQRPYLPGRLPKSVTHLFHQAVYDCPIDANYYLFIVRDPLARSRSAFVYGRPDKDGNNPHEHQSGNLNRLYNECPFHTSNDLARLGLKKGGIASPECKQRARDMLRGTVRYENHHYYNYQYYYEGIPKGAKILVIRTEHMEEDWNKLELGLGGEEMTNIDFPRDNTNQKEDRDLILGDEERMLLCHELCQEILVYKSILERAMNIDDSQLETSMEELRGICPNEADVEECSFDRPDISGKLASSRGPIDNLK